MGVLGKLPGSLLIHFGTVVMLGTIILCYVIAVMDGHVVAWLPTISECGENPPEQYFFRYGILTGGLLLVVLAIYIYTADFSFSHNQINVSMGVIAGLALGVVAVCAANENNVVHTTSAVIFFVLEDFLMARIILQRHTSLSRVSMVIKSVCTVVAWLATIGRFLLMAHHIPEILHLPIDIPVLPIVEWANALAIAVFSWSFAVDFEPFYFIAALKEDGNDVQPVKEMKHEFVGSDSIKTGNIY